MTPWPASLPPLFVDVGGVFSHPSIFNRLDITAPLLPAAMPPLTPRLPAYSFEDFPGM